MEIWAYDGKVYEITSGYSVPDDAWHYELTGQTGPPGTGPHIAIAIPDATPDGPFTPMPAESIVVHAAGGVVPWLILVKLIHLVGSRRFEVNHFHYGDAESWCYELYEVDADSTENNFLDVRIPDASPESGPFVPMPVDHVTLTVHGRQAIPWPVFRRFLGAIQAAGDIVDSTGARPTAVHRL